MTEEERQEAIEHRDVLLHIRAVLATKSGTELFKYLFKHFEVSQLPELGLEGNFLHDKLGFLRAGNSIFKLVAEANAQIAANLLAENEKERYAELYKQAEISS
jgi:hypothetical protein